MQPFSCSSENIFHTPSAPFESSKDCSYHFRLLIHHHSLSRFANENLLSGLSSAWRTWSTCSTRRRRTSTRCWRWSATSRPGRRGSTSKAWRSGTCDHLVWTEEVFYCLKVKIEAVNEDLETNYFLASQIPRPLIVPFKVPLISIKLCQPTWLSFTDLNESISRKTRGPVLSA